jgi:hypothetical protein
MDRPPATEIATPRLENSPAPALILFTIGAIVTGTGMKVSDGGLTVVGFLVMLLGAALYCGHPAER